MKEEKGIRHRGEGAYLRCPVSTSVQFRLCNEGSSEYICVCEGRESLRPNFFKFLNNLLVYSPVRERLQAVCCRVAMSRCPTAAARGGGGGRGYLAGGGKGGE